jgi:nucleotide-binding universal stress UspA family protein
MGQVVVGVDESEGGASALRWAAREGEVRGWTVTAVMAWGLLDERHLITGVPFEPDYCENDAEEALAGIVAGAVGEDAAARIERSVVCDLPARALLDASSGADLLAVGARGMGGFKGLLLGSVSQQCLHHTTIPIAVVRGEPAAADHHQRIVVAVDDSDTARRALAWALDEARARSGWLTVVNAWHPPYVGGYPYTGAVFDLADFELLSREILAAVLDGADTSGLVTPVERVSALGGAAQAILATAAGADLIVMGSRGLGGFKGLLLGSVTAQVTHHAETTVVVIPPDA